MNILAPVRRDRVLAELPQYLRKEAALHMRKDFHPRVTSACQEHRTGTVGFKISKVIVVGDLSVGKTCLINRFCKDTFDKNYKATIGVDFEMERFEVLGVPFSLQLWDTAGQERFKCIASTYYRGAQAIIIVFSLNDVASLEHTRQWLTDALKENDPSSVLLFLVGSKKDLSTPAQYVLMERDALKVAQEMKAEYWAVSSLTDVNRLPSWERGHLLAAVASSTDASTFSSEGEFKDIDRCCWKHKQCTGHLIHPFAPDYGHYKLHLHSISHCGCDCRVKDYSEKTNSSSSRDVGPTCSRDVGSTCLNIIQTPCFAKLIPEEECVERFWYGWCKSYRPVSVAVIHHPIHHECGADDLNEEEEEEEESKPPIPIQVGPTTATPDTGRGMGTIKGAPDSAAPITIWRSESPTGKSQGSKVIKKVKKKNEKEKSEEETDEKAKLKKKVKKGKLTKKKSPVKSEPSPPDLSRSASPRELARMSESSPDSREDLESEDSYNDRRREEPFSDDVVETSSPRKREKNTVQAKKVGAKASPVKVNKRKSPPASNLG